MSSSKKFPVLVLLCFVFLQYDPHFFIAAAETVNFLKNVENELPNFLKNCGLHHDVSKDDVKLYLSSENNSSVRIDASNASRFLNPSLPTKFLVPGWQTDPFDPWLVNATQAYKREQNCNVINVDWYKLSKNPDYITPAIQTKPVGYFLGDFIVKVFSKNLNNIHLIGHSLGAHVAGFAGKKVLQQCNQTLDRISGLDVAAPLFQYPVTVSKNCRLDKDDATFVDIIHTQAGPVGVSRSIGDVDFFPNGGKIQPDCPKTPIKFLQCGHDKAQVYFIDSILNQTKYKSYKCDDYLKYVLRRCNKNQFNYLGEGAFRNTTGTFYLTITDTS